VVQFKLIPNLTAGLVLGGQVMAGQRSRGMAMIWIPTPMIYHN